jgi:DivIVA domain-containing protein
MSATELDLPLLPSAEQIKRREFATIRRGYDPEQVRDYLRQVSTQVETLEQELRDARLEAGSGPRASAPMVLPEPEPAPEPQPDAYEELAERLADLIRAADEQAQRLIDEAHEEATRMVGEARTDADRIRVDAQARAEEARTKGSEFLEEARTKADQVLSSLASRRENLVDQLQQMQTRLVGVAEELESALGTPGGDADDIFGPSKDERATDASTDDPRYEDLWVSGDSDAPLADLPPLDLDFGEDADE